MAHHFFIEGPLGSGKTLMMSILAHHFKHQVQRIGGDVQLFSNYHLKDAIQMDHYEDWYQVAEAQGSIVCWDEAQMAFSNRKWSGYGNGIATEVMMYTRKMQSVQMYCSPSINNVDSRIRQIVEILIRVRKEGKRGFRLYFYDYQTNQFMRTAFFPMYKAKKIFKVKLYDTYQMVSFFPLPPNEREGNKFFDKLEEVHDLNRKKQLGIEVDAIIDTINNMQEDAANAN